jgi:hypothetical protein
MGTVEPLQNPRRPVARVVHEAVRRIQAEHSRSRYYTHPRSLMNQPPQYPPYRYWGYGY